MCLLVYSLIFGYVGLCGAVEVSDTSRLFFRFEDCERSAEYRSSRMLQILRTFSRSSSSVAPPLSNVRKLVPPEANRQVYNVPSALSRTRVQPRQKGCVTDEIKPISPVPSTSRYRSATSLLRLRRVPDVSIGRDRSCAKNARDRENRG